MVTIISGGPIRPASATAAPGAPPKRDPKTTEKLTTLGPGRNWDRAKASLNSSAVIHRRCSTIIRRAQGSAPPKPEIETMTNARNSSDNLGRTTAGDGGGAAGADMRLRITSLRKPRLASSVQITLAQKTRSANDWLHTQLTEREHAAAGIDCPAGGRGGMAAGGTGARLAGWLSGSPDHSNRSLRSGRRQRCVGARGCRSHGQVTRPACGGRKSRGRRRFGWHSPSRQGPARWLYARAWWHRYAGH